jgi:membrane-bound lytic murein transglycosylase D
MASVAKQYGVSTRQLASMNGLSAKAKLRVGRYVRIPESTVPVLPTLVATTTAPPPAKTESALPEPEEPAPKIYVVRRGESITEISKKTSVPEAQLLKINRIKNPNFLFEGQRLLLAASDLSADDAAEAAVPQPPAPPVPAVVASAQPASGGVPAAVAERESEEDAAAVEKTAKPTKPTEKEEPVVSAAQAEAQGPALGPAAESAESADPIDYTVAKDNTIRVAAAETLGHYADWLGVSAGALRKLNNMKYGKPVLIGRKIKLPFSKSGSREAFEEKRRDYHRTLQAQYFAAHRILGTEVYIARKGDSLWNVTQRFARLPVWLLQQYNPDTDFSEMRAGTQIVVPRVEEVVAAGGSANGDT